MTPNDITDAVNRGLGWLLVFLMGVAVLNVVWQVFTRYVISAPSQFTQELARYLLIWIGILGSGYAAGQRAHLSLELLPESLEGRQLSWLKIVIEGSVLAFAFIVMVVGGVRLVYILLLSGQTSATLNLLIGYVYAVVPLSGLLISFYSVIHIMEEVRSMDEERMNPESSSAEA
jgi:TRAP-type C4-dicarboxylate transport system permease small subunit